MWLNTDYYSTLELTLTLTGSILWVAVYVFIIIDANKNRYMEMPLIAIAGNIAWEAIYSWAFDGYINLGLFLKIGYRAWFFLDIYIVILALRYSYKQFDSDLIRNNIKSFFAILFIFYFILIWACGISEIDNLPIHSNGSVRLGGVSAYVLNIVISFSYIYLFLRNRSKVPFNKISAWLKFLGTLCFSIFFLLVDSKNYMLLSMAGIVVVLDVTYLFLLSKYPAVKNLKSIGGKPVFTLNPNFEILWEKYPELRSYYKMCGITLRELTFEHWSFVNKTGKFHSNYTVLEGDIIRQVATGSAYGDDVYNTNKVLRDIVKELDLEYKKIYLFNDSSKMNDGDLDSRKETIVLFSDPIFSKIEMYLTSSRFVRASLDISVPINPSIMNKWNVFTDVESCFISLMRTFVPLIHASHNINDKPNFLNINNFNTIRLKQIYQVLSKIADSELSTIEAIVIPENDPYEEVFDALNLVMDDKKRQVNKLEIANNILAENNIEIKNEHNRSEKLLLNILPEVIANRLKNGEVNIADKYENVAILFTDIVNFTEFSTTVTAQELVNSLDSIFSLFDTLTDKYHLEKIKTIGDSYMVACGLPIVSNDYAINMAHFALEMNDLIEIFKTSNGYNFKMRIGIHSGEVVAGIIGKNKFSYDLWGDAVNTASRMESNGEPGKIHISEDYYNQLIVSGQFNSSNFIYRGELEIKGKGLMKTYFLQSKIV
ncbi:MAG: adenylate/guanylate cyclase domain-containing protein [Chlorobiota bacterium]|nr:MAG: adenylate/guanylate cyclase domain-containing protein [Chlorobiota bacterium]